MKVYELIEQLSKYPKDMRVIQFTFDDTWGDRLQDFELRIRPAFNDPTSGRVCLVDDGFSQGCDNFEWLLKNHPELEGSVEVYDLLTTAPPESYEGLTFTKESV